jgi:Protein of unknown function (DUF3768)
MEQASSDQERIRALNDEMRTAGPLTQSANRWVFTAGVLALGDNEAAAAVERVMDFAEFDDDNDPYGEHDFGAFDLAGQRLFWKIDYYDRAMEGGSPDPTDGSVTVRVLTTLLASEY